jgi:N-acetyl-anhydromuramyl-L-alanine amidase AmpD
MTLCQLPALRVPASSLVLSGVALLAAACSSSSSDLAPEIIPESINQSIVACGERLFVGAPVVLWTDPLGYSAYETELHFERPSVGVKRPASGELRYKPGRTNRQTGEVLVTPETGSFSQLKNALDMFVVHYDVCGTSQTCFKVLHDRRGLSVQFMIDVDGTIYQTLDLRDTAWHASQTNARSVGVEIAQIGAYPLNDAGNETLARWYEEGPTGTRLTLPKDAADLGVLTSGFEGRPARASKVLGRVQGSGLQQYDYTPEQYASLVKLTATLCHHFPKIKPDAPRDADGRVLTVRMDEAAELEFGGIVGHYHVSRQNVDPGPAFDWRGFLARVRARLTAM